MNGGTEQAHPRQTVWTAAAPHHGLVTRPQLRDLGVSAATIDRLVGRGDLEVLHRGVYRAGGAPKTDDQELLAAVLAAGEGAVASHRAASWLWGSSAVRELLPEVTVLGQRRVELPFAVHRRLPSLGDLAYDQVVRRGIPVTTPLCTLVQLGAVVPWWTVRSTLDDFVGRKLVTVRAVQATLGRLGGRGRRGAGVLRTVLEQRGLGVISHEGALEPMLADLCDTYAVPRPEYQWALVLAGQRRRLDFAYPEHKVAIEVDGYESHSRYDVFEDDRARANELVVQGWIVLRFTRRQLLHRPGWVAATILAALVSRAPERSSESSRAGAR
jgi:Transcriptional regulator, AbiEi antitoxin/Protein of unknown function (DUF559)